MNKHEEQIKRSSKLLYKADEIGHSGNQKAAEYMIKLEERIKELEKKDE